MRNKKALSVVVGYVILIVIAISLSILVYNWLRIQLPKEKTECSEDVSIYIDNEICNPDNVAGDISVTFVNKGLFNVDGVYLKYLGVTTDQNRLPTTSLERKGSKFPKEGIGMLYFREQSNQFNKVALAPTDSYNDIFKYQGSIAKISITPFQVVNNKIIICEKANIIQEIGPCTANPAPPTP